MLAKKQLKTRTSKSKNKKNLRWWYAVPVIVVVALAGYLVIRYSQAGVRTFSRMSDSGLTNRSGTFRASFRLPLKKATSVDPVYTTVGTLRESAYSSVPRTSPIAGKRICANIQTTGGSARYTMRASFYNGNSHKPPRMTTFGGLIEYNAVPASLTRFSAGSASVSGNVNGKTLKCLNVPSRYGRTYADRPYYAIVSITPFGGAGASGVTTSSTPSYNSGRNTGQFGVAEVWVQ